MNENVPSGSRCLTKHNMSDPFMSREFDQSISHATRLQLNHLCTEVFSEPNVFLKSGVVLGLNSSKFFNRRLDIDRIPITRQSSGYTRPNSQQLLRTAA